MKFPKNLKIAFIDTETMPNLGAFWASGPKLSIGPEAIIQERFMLSVQWSWNNEKEVHVVQANIKKRDDTKVIKALTKILQEADIVVGHNVRKFDLRWAAGRALLLGLEPTRSKFVKHIDTMILAKQAFYLNSYKMDYICQKLGIKGKIKTSFSDWMAILNVDNAAELAQERANYLCKYGKHDINMNRELFIKILPHVKLTNKLEMMLYGKSAVCPECQSFKVHGKGLRVTKTGKNMHRFVCGACGHNYQIEEGRYKHG